MATRCYACKRVLSNPESMKLGIGPICRGQRRREQTAQEKLDHEAGKCHRGFNCGNPQHVETLLGRLRHQVEAWPKWLAAEAAESDDADIPAVIDRDRVLEQARQLVASNAGRLIAEHMQTILDALGLRKPAVQVPLVERQSLEVMLRTTGQFMNPANEIQPGQFRIPPNIGDQYRGTVLRGLGICPHGLDCREPVQAVGAIYCILGVLRNEVEPLFRDTSYGGLAGASDAAYIACMNMLEVLGLEDEASHIHYRDLPKLRKAAERNARRWERLQARKRGVA